MTTGEKALRELFDYQRFEGEVRLGGLIEKALARWAKGGIPLLDEDLELNAAGDPDILRIEEDTHE
ncbi:MAG: hypothetical protein PHP07_04095 [Eubacteriales bacterium]|nr:hypothetical protein [Eubacteriales bacterium]MDD3572117.1 hypothetical protein [Eubacteriales bacterium]MDD4135109.1 hypothetical protein [Eubacteriales bacterium]NLO13605.1 hypothetical protein [Clostridiales bacterium]